MRKRISILLLILTAPLSSRADFDLAPFLKQRHLAPQQSAVYAVWAKTGEPIAAYQENKLLTPASVLKVLTSYCALKKLGPSYTFATRLYSEGPIQKERINNLMVQGEGDPSLVSERLWLLIQELKTQGLKKIQGNIYIDAGYFDAQDYPGRQENNHRAYNSLTSAVSLNFNSVAIPTAAGTRYKSVADPIAYFGKTFSELLKSSGIDFQGKIFAGKMNLPHLLYTFDSKPLSLIVWDMNKFSNNFIAEQVVKHLGAKFLGSPGSTKKGVQILKQCLEELASNARGVQTRGVQTQNFVIENGSGLSYSNKISAKALVQTLVAGFNDPALQPELISSLSVAGHDGTMKSRKSPKQLEGLLRAKTGSLNGISSLAGFIPAANGEWIAFCFLLNQFKGGLWEAQKWQDNLLLELRHD